MENRTIHTITITEVPMYSNKEILQIVGATLILDSIFIALIYFCKGL